MSLEYGYLIINESFKTCLFFPLTAFEMQESEEIDSGDEPSPLTDTILRESVSSVAETGKIAKPPAIAIQIVLDNTSAETKKENSMLLTLRMIIVVKNPILNILPKYIFRILLIEQK